MRVRDLIERLEELDPDFEVALDATDQTEMGLGVSATAPAQAVTEKPGSGYVVITGSAVQR
jgi:hypothetical protein